MNHRNALNEHPPAHAHDPEICGICEAWYTPNTEPDHYADFVQCGECAEWHSESLGCHKCRLLKRSYAIEGLEEAELRLLINALPSTGATAELRQILTYAYNEIVAESFDGWPEPDYGDFYTCDEPF